MMDEIQYSFSLSQLLQLDSEGEFFTSIEGLINYKNNKKKIEFKILKNLENKLKLI